MRLSDPQECLSDFEPHPWYHVLLASPLVTLQPTASRNPPYPNPTEAHSLFSSTLFTSTGLRAMQSFHAKVTLPRSQTGASIFESSASHSTDGRSNSSNGNESLDQPMNDALSDEWLVVVSLGTGLNGPAGIVHGGLAMTLLDSAMAVRAFRAAGGKPVVTIRYEAEFKRKIRAPCVVLCRAWLHESVIDVENDGDKNKDRGTGDDGEEREGTIRTRGRLEDGMGNVYLEATARFAKRRERARVKL